MDTLIQASVNSDKIVSTSYEIDVVGSRTGKFLLVLLNDRLDVFVLIREKLVGFTNRVALLFSLIFNGANH